MSDNQFISYGNVDLFNVPHAEYIANEVIRDDCYDMKRIPDGATVIDLGAFYGEFAIYCAKVKKCRVVAVEPCQENSRILEINLARNKADAVKLVRAAMSNRGGSVAEFAYNAKFPPGSKIGASPTGQLVATMTLGKLISTISRSLCESPIVVKLDIEGAEKEVFESIEKWSPLVSLVLMEWHNHAGATYRDALIANGFTVSLEAGGLRPRKPWHESQEMGFIYASKGKPK